MILNKVFFLLLIAITLHRHIPRKFNNQWVASGQHDRTCFTQGLSFINDTHILESCGLYGRSYFHILSYNFTHQNQTSLTQLHSSPLPSQIFAEGSIYFPVNKLIYILTWKEQVVLRFNSTDFTEVLPRLTWTREGWGMTHNNTHIFISTGSNQIFVTDSELNILEVLPTVNERGLNLKNINEIEWVQQNGQSYIYANIWQTSEIVKISLSDKKVVLRFEELKMTSNSRQSPYGSEQDVLNGIAFDKKNVNFILTGKMWPMYYVSYLDLAQL